MWQLKQSTVLFLALAARLVIGAPVATFDYIVVGSGPGGGPLAANLARAGYSTLLLEAGDDQGDNPNAATLANFIAADNDPLTRWDFWSKHSDDPEQELRYKKMVWRKEDGEFYTGLEPPAGAKQLGIWYPRAGTLGGCAMHNAGVTALPSNHDWDIIANRTGDASWKAENMNKYFVRLERNNMFKNDTAGHGFNGWLDTTTAPMSWVRLADGKAILGGIANSTGQDPTQLEALVERDLNNAADPNRDQGVGFFNMVSHADKVGKRSSPNTYIRATLKDPAKYPLTVKLNSLVTKVLFDEKAETPTAIGVEVLEGPHQYSADPAFDKTKQGTKVTYTAAREVIVSGGAFNSPQILKLSGVGPAAELKKFNITVVKDLPGVGEQLGDNYEASIISIAKRPLTGMGPPVVLMWKTQTANPPSRNIYAWCGQFSFEGFWPGFPTNYGPNQWECALVHMTPKSQAGSVTLKSADPQDMPDINFRFFKNHGDEDLTELLDAIKTIRKGVNGAVSGGLGPWNEVHPCPGENKECTDDEQKKYIKEQAYSHHATSSCSIGADSDPLAVLDSKFRVRGVKNLRVVDASAFPVVPGAFPVLPTFMLAEKATDDIIEAAKAAPKPAY